jgi:multidrug efflux pump subunit AcrA (membrane-fusion protein)
MEAVVLEIGSRIETAYREVEAALTRRDLWRDILMRRRELFPLDRGGPERLRELELDLMRTEIEEAEALLAKLDRELGNVIVQAEFEGVIDQVYVSKGDVLEPDAPLVSYFDPSQMWVTAYPTPALSGQAYSGRICRIVLEDSHEPFEGRVRTVGMVWVHCPPALYKKSHEGPDMRIPVRIDCTDRRGMALFRPNMRVKVVFKQ